MRRTIAFLAVGILALVSHAMGNVTYGTTSTGSIITITSDDFTGGVPESAYVPHVFAIEKGEQEIRNPQWILDMPLSDGTVETAYLADSNLSCQTEPIADYRKYLVDETGCIKASLSFSCTIEGKKETSAPFCFSLEVKPYIEYAKIEKIVDNSPYDSYNAHFSVKYWGAESITYSV